jgi:cell division topological specificity factor
MSLVNSFLDYLRGAKPKSASVAKERLQLILAHENARNGVPDYLPALRQELLGVIAKYIEIDPEQIKMHVDRQGDINLLELNIMLPEGGDKRTAHIVS